MTLIITGLFGAFLTLTGLAFLFTPGSVAQAFGVDPSHMADLGMVPVAGIRQVVFGLTLVALALRQQRAALGTVVLIGALVPLGDFWLAGQAMGHAAVIRQLITLPVFLVLGLILVRQ